MTITLLMIKNVIDKIMKNMIFFLIKKLFIKFRD